MTARTQWALVTGIVLAAGVGALVATNVIGGGIAPVEAGSVAPPFRALTTAAGVPARAKTLAD